MPMPKKANLPVTVIILFEVGERLLENFRYVLGAETYERHVTDHDQLGVSSTRWSPVPIPSKGLPTPAELMRRAILAMLDRTRDTSTNGVFELHLGRVEP